MAGSGGVAVSLGVNSDSWGPLAEDLGLEGVVDLEVLDGGICGVGSQVGVGGLGALVVGRLLGIDDVLLLVPDTGVLGLVEVDEGDDGVASDWGHGGLVEGLGEGAEHLV